MRAGCSAIFRLPPIAADLSLLITLGAGLAQISADGMDVSVSLRDYGSEIVLLVYHVPAFHPGSPWQEFSIPVRFRGGTSALIIECRPGPGSDPTGDWLAVYELVVASDTQSTLYRSRGFREYRRRNEIQVLNHVYDRPLYNLAPQEDPVAPNANILSTILLGQMIGRPVPDFQVLLHRKLASRPRLRILSLASGAARVEAELVRNVRPGLIDLTLTDINAQLLERAATQFAPHRVRTELMDLNEATLPGQNYDIIVCVSGLHHIVELELLLKAVASKLKPDGEFWLIGEYVGRTGARLWPDALAAANEFFRALPERYRYNHVFKRTDSELPNVDCSIVSFEGIRSEEIEGNLADWFDTDWADKRDCIIWRLFDAIYGPNYDMADSEDRKLIRKAVEIDYELLQKSTKPVSLNGVYVPRAIRHSK